MKNIFDIFDKVIESDLISDINSDDRATTVFISEIGLSDVDKAVMFMHMLKKCLGATGTKELLDRCGTELEVYGLIPNAERAKVNHCAYMESRGPIVNPIIMHAAMNLARNDDAPEYASYMEIEEKEHAIINSIVKKYLAKATEEVSKMIVEYKQKASSMNFEDADLIRQVIDKVSDSIPTAEDATV